MQKFLDKFIRPLIKLLGAHKWISGILLISIIGAVYFSFRIKEKTQGMLSAPLVRGDIVESVYGIGTVTANKSFQLRPGVTSFVTRLYVQEGDHVKKGDRLAVMDEITYYAPFDGTITFLPYKLGENIFSQTVALSLVDLSDSYLSVSLEQQAALRVKQGQAVKISFDTDRGQTYVGIVKSVYSNANSFLARINVTKFPEKILPGMTADVAIEINRHKNVLLLPTAAIEGSKVWVQKPRSLPKQVNVKIGLVDKDLAELTDGNLKEGDRLLIRKKITP